MSASLSGRIQTALRERGRSIAVVAEDTSLSGARLHELALELAAALRDHGVRAGDTVGVLVDRSAASLIAILAILETGSGYLPLDPTTPEQWLARLLALADVRLLVTPDASHPAARRLCAQLPLGILDALTRPSETPRSWSRFALDELETSRIAYVMGTSGTTGEPKAVPIRESSLLHYCDAFAARVGGRDILSGMRMASVTTLAADLGNTMVFPSLLFGGELHLVPAEIGRVPQAFADYVQRHEIDALKTVPTHLRALLQVGPRTLPSRLLVVGGEPFGLDLLEQLEACAPSAAVFNHYGPTEATVGVAMHQVRTVPGEVARLRARGHRTVPIGTALGESQLHVVDEQLEPCVQGQPGELLIGGPCVSPGYVGAVEPSRRSFVTSRWTSPSLSYRTGDCARAWPTGEVEVLGRLDRQLKIRGHRVEALGVEEQLRAHPAVLDAFVDQREHGELGATLVAWVHAREGVTERDLRAFLGDRLPGPMVPSRIVRMDTLPRTSNGKLDARALPDPAPMPRVEKPRSVEEAVLQVFAHVLALPIEEVNDNFFRLGGHSLAALCALGRLREDHGIEVAVEDFYADATPHAIALAARTASSTSSVPACRQRAAEAVSPQAHALWMHIQLSPDDPAYAIPIRLRIQGSVAPEHVRQALRQFVARHDALRTRYRVHDGRPFAVVDPDGRATLQFADEAAQAESRGGGLSIEKGPLVRASVTSFTTDVCHVDLLVHHIAFDGASVSVLVRELGAMLGNERLLPVQTASEYRPVGWDPRPIGAGARARFGLPAAKFVREGVRRCHQLALPPALWPQMEACATGLGTTPFVIAAAAWAFVLSRQDGEAAVTVATPADLRDPSLQASLVGYHTNVVVVELELSPGEAVRDVIARTHLAVGRALSDRHRPYARRVVDQREASGTPPARTLLTLERLERCHAAQLLVEQEPVSQARPSFDLDVCILRSDSDARLQIHHLVEVCTEGRARCLLEQLGHVLAQFVRDPARSSSDVEILPSPWRDRMLEWSRGAPVVLAEHWGARAFSKQVSANPSARALLWPGGEWSRAQLAEAVARASRTLRERGVGPGHAVSVALPPSPALAIAWHAVHAIGAAVLALDPVWPQSRLEAARRQASSTVRITSLDEVNLEILGSAPADAPHPSDLAYLILTSGSTGGPKLVAIQQSALANELCSSAAEFPIDVQDRVLAHSSPGFDVAVWDMLGPLSWGACLVLPGLNRRYDVSHLAQCIREQRVTVLQAVPSLLGALLAELGPGPSSLRLLLSGGEEMPPSLPAAVAAQLPAAALVNTYGPSETTIDATFHRVEGFGSPTHRVPLGRPVGGTCTYVLDEHLRLLPPGAWGELAIGGNSVGLGYLNDPTENARRFVADPHANEPGARIYLTGDRARWNDDGLLEFGGRRDHQVKVRGNRVELAEVEAALRTLPAVQDAAVVLQDGGTLHARLVAFVVSSTRGALTARDLYAQCVQLLPSYMTPSAFALVEALPRLSSGKVSRDDLPLAALVAPGAAAPPRTEMEARVASVWSELLSAPTPDPELPFFASGGTSLLIPALQLRLEQALGVTLTVPELFEHSTIRAQSGVLEQRAMGAEISPGRDSGRGKLRREAYAARRNPRTP